MIKVNYAGILLACTQVEGDGGGLFFYLPEQHSFVLEISRTAPKQLDMSDLLLP